MSKSKIAIREIELTGPSGTASKIGKRRGVPSQDEIVRGMLNPGKRLGTRKPPLLTQIVSRMLAR